MFLRQATREIPEGRRSYRYGIKVDFETQFQMKTLLLAITGSYKGTPVLHGDWAFQELTAD